MKHENSLPSLQIRTKFMEQSPFWEADSRSINQEFPAFYGTGRFDTVFTAAATGLYLSHMNSIHALTSYLDKIYSNILPSTLMFPKWPLPLRFTDQNFACTYHFSNAF
jgi:hypothetical protein